MSDNNSTRRTGYNNKVFSNNFDRIFGTEEDRQKRAIVTNAEIKKAASSKSAYIMKPIEPFKSHVDGSIISDRRQLKEHNQRNGVTNSADYSANFMNQRRNSLGAAQDRTAKKERIEALQQTMRTKGYE